jgi:N,N-dimethylformamidase
MPDPGVHPSVTRHSDGGPSLRRRRFLQAAAVTAAAAAVPASLLGVASAEAATDPLQKFIQLVPGGNGIIYAIQADGTLLWYRHTSYLSGAATWANNGAARVIGTGWHIFRTVLADASGQLFGFMPDGSIRWYKYVISNLNTGAGSWAGGGGAVIGSGFDAYPRVFGGWNGVIYGIDDSGQLWWHQYTADNGTAGWANGGGGSIIGSGFKDFPRIWADPNGVIYAVREGASYLYWYRYLGTNGSVSWANGGSGIVIGSAWGENYQKLAFANGSGSLYALKLDTDQVNGTDSALYWLRLTNSETVTASSGSSWANGGKGLEIGSGFTFEETANLQGYPSSLSVPQAGTVGIAVSTTFQSVTWSVLQLAPNAGNPVTVLGPTTIPGELQTLPAGYRVNGCGWANSFSVQIPATWQSGVYAAQLESPEGLTYDVVFVVRPASPVAPFAVVLPTNTYNAYNTWAGHNRYSTQNGNPVTLTFLRPTTSTEVDPPAVGSHTLHSDLFLLRWMTANNIRFDCYCDSDLNGTVTWPASYQAVVIASHSEYWSDSMRANLVSYLDNGGRLICTGGNALYERTTLSTDGNALTWSAVKARDLFGNHGEWESQIVGANWNGAAFMTFSAYQVNDASHPLLAGTGLANGAQFGATGYDGAASGWEVNGPIDTTNVQGTATLLADSFTQASGGGAMVYIDRGSGSWVFSSNSISFNGALAYDQNMSTILKNVFTAAAS